MNPIALLLALSLGACAELPPLPVLSPPAAVPRLDQAPQIPEATFSLTLSAPLSELAALLRDQLTLPSAPDWQLVTQPKASPEVEVRYEAELLEPEIAIAGQTLILKLRVAYFGALRARVHTPFGWLRLTKNSKWGDAERRAQIEVEIHTELELGADYQLRPRSSLHALSFSAPPIDKLCAGGSFKICVPAETAAGPIHAELERRIRPRAESALTRVDQLVSERASLAAAAERMWRRLNAPGPALGSGESPQLRPRALSISPPFVAGDQASVVLNIFASPIFTREPPAPSPPLPALSVAAPSATVVPLDWIESVAALNQGLTRALRAQASGEEGLPTKLTLLGPAAGTGRYLFALELARAGQVRSVYAEATLLPAGDQLKLDAVSLTPESAQLLALAKVDAATFTAAICSVGYRPSAALAERVNGLRGLLSESIAPLPIAVLSDVRPTLVSVHSANEGLWLHAELR